MSAPYDSWSPREKAGQLFMLAFPGKDPAAAVPLIAEWNLCGCYLSQDNASTFGEARRLSASLNAASRLSPLPLLLGVDQEGAWGVLVPESSTGPGNMALGAAEPRHAQAMYAAIGREMVDAGFPLLLAPCADVNSDPRSTIINTRSFGERPAEVAERVAAAVRGAKSSGILATVKHFPGHGATREDTHRGLPRVDKARDRLEAEDFLPFRAGIAAGADVVMTSHIVFPAIDPGMPATLSKPTIQGLLRGEMGFGGVVLSDSMNMGAMRRSFPSGEAAVLALLAGVDVVMLSEEHYDHSREYLEKQLETLRAVEAAIRSGRLPEDEVDRKLDRILGLRSRARTAAIAAPGAPAPREAERIAAEAACSLLIDGGAPWPVPRGPDVLYVNATPRSAYGRINNPRGIGPNQDEPAFDAFRRALSELRPEARFLERDEFLSLPRARLDAAAALVVVTEDYPLPGEDFPASEQKALVRSAIASFGSRCLVVGLRSPYEAMEYAGLGGYLCAFSSRPCAARAAARALHEGLRGGGRSPVSFLPQALRG